MQTEDKASLDVDVNRLWDLKTIGIEESRSQKVGSMKNIETTSPLIGMILSDAHLKRRPPRFIKQLYHRHALS